MWISANSSSLLFYVSIQFSIHIKVFISEPFYISSNFFLLYFVCDCFAFCTEWRPQSINVPLIIALKMLLNNFPNSLGCRHHSANSVSILRFRKIRDKPDINWKYILWPHLLSYSSHPVHPGISLEHALEIKWKHIFILASVLFLVIVIITCLVSLS